MFIESEEEQYLLKVLSNTSIFAGLTKIHLKNILPLAQKIQFPIETFIIKEGDIADGLFVIIQGRVEVLKKSAPDNNKLQKIADLGTGQSFGEIALIDQSPRSASIRTLEPTTVLKISINNIDKIASLDNQIYATLLKNIAMDLSRRLRYANDMVILQSK